MAPCGGIAAAKMAAGLVNCSLSVGMTLRLDDLCFTSCSPISLTFLSHVSLCHLFPGIPMFRDQEFKKPKI